VDLRWIFHTNPDYFAFDRFVVTSDHPPICDYEGSDYQTAFWEEGGREYEDRVEAVALKRLLPSEGCNLLELGAGAGRNTPRYQDFETVFLLDYSRTQLELAQEKLGRSDRYVYVAADVYRLPFVDGLFSTATMIRVLHHMADAPRALNQVRRVLQPGGIFILEFANKLNLKAIIRYLTRRQTWSPFTLDPVEFVSLNYDFHPKAVRAWLREADFTVERQLTVSHFRIPFFKRFLPLGLLVFLDSFAQLTGNWWQLSPSVFVRNRAVGDTPIGPQGVIFRCPACGSSPLMEVHNGLDCPGCGRQWPSRGGIYDFRDQQDA
jgi:ubiquinone/menaquinone biosynthesis C-methylase UbiE